MVRECESMQEVYEWVKMECRLRHDAYAKGLWKQQPVSPGELWITCLLLIYSYIIIKGQSTTYDIPPAPLEFDTVHNHLLIILIVEI